MKELTGGVTVNNKPAKVGQTLVAGDQLEVPLKAAVRLQYEDGTHVLLTGRTADGTHATIGASKTDGTMKVMLLQLAHGLLSFAVPQSAHGKSRYEFEAVSSLTVVRGTSGKIEATPAGSTVSIHDGTVSVQNTSNGQSTDVTHGQTLTISATGTVTGPSAYDFSKDGDLYDVRLDLRTFDAR